MENYFRAKNLIEQSEKISIFPSPHLQQDTFPASLALFYSLNELKKTVNLFVEKPPKKFEFLLKGGELHLPQADFLISIKEAKAKLSHLFYEKSPQGINLYFRTEGGEVKPEDLLFQPIKPGELLITLGTKESSVIEKFLQNQPPPKVLNIDYEENEKIGEVFLKVPSESCFSEIILNLLKHFEEKVFTQETINSLLAGVISHFYFSSFGQTSPQTFKTIVFLLEKGGDLKEILYNLHTSLSENSLKLLGKILTTSHYFQEKNLCWFWIKKSDFAETKTTPKDLGRILEKLIYLISPSKNLLCLWESSASETITRGFFYSKNRTFRQEIAKNFPSTEKGESVIFQSKETQPEKIVERIINFII